MIEIQLIWALVVRRGARPSLSLSLSQGPSPSDGIRILRAGATARDSDNPGGVVAELGHGALDLAGEDVAEGGEGALLAAHQLVPPTDQLDELAGVDVRVPSAVDVLHQLGRD